MQNNKKQNKDSLTQPFPYNQSMWLWWVSSKTLPFKMGDLWNQALSATRLLSWLDVSLYLSVAILLFPGNSLRIQPIERNAKLREEIFPATSLMHLDSALLPNCYISTCFSNISQYFFFLSQFKVGVRHIPPLQRSLINRETGKKSQRCDNTKLWHSGDNYWIKLCC